MTPGKRNRSPRGPSSARPELIDIRQVRLARQRRRLACLVPAGRRRARQRGDRLRLRAAPCPTGSASGPSRDLRVNVPKFQRLNQVQTNRLREQAARAGPADLLQRPGADPRSCRSCSRT